MSSDDLVRAMGQWLGFDPARVPPEARLGEELVVEPFDMVELLYQLEVDLGLVLPLERSWRGLTPRELATLVLETFRDPLGANLVPNV